MPGKPRQHAIPHAAFRNPLSEKGSRKTRRCSSLSSLHFVFRRSFPGRVTDLPFAAPFDTVANRSGSVAAVMVSISTKEISQGKCVCFFVSA